MLDDLQLKMKGPAPKTIGAKDTWQRAIHVYGGSLIMIFGQFYTAGKLWAIGLFFWCFELQHRREKKRSPYSLFAMNNFVFEYVITHITGRGGGRGENQATYGNMAE